MLVPHSEQFLQNFTRNGQTINAVLGYEKLTANVEAKWKVLRCILFAMSKLNSMVRNKKLLQDIKRRINQSGLVRDSSVFKSNKISFECLNDVSLTWDEAFTNLVESVPAPKSLTPLDVDQMIGIGHLLKGCSFVSVKLLMSHIGIKSDLKNAFVTELLQFFPVVHVKDPEATEDTNIINIWQMDLYKEISKVAEYACVPFENVPSAKESITGPQKARGRKPFVRKFPQMVDEATKLVRLHGYSAHSRRRESRAVSAGVSIEDVYNHLLTVVPRMREIGLSINTVRYMFCAPNKGAKSGTLYKGYVEARSPKKGNNTRKKHEDAHYLFSRVKYRREMATMFNDEVFVLSVDCMNQLRLGSNTIVSHYHQNHKLYPVDDFPETDNEDIKPIISKAMKDGKKVVIVITDTGPDRNPEHYQNLLYYYRLWKEHDLDTLIVMSYAPGYSAYNSIEHLRSVLSKALTGVRGISTENLFKESGRKESKGLILAMVCQSIGLNVRKNDQLFDGVCRPCA